MCPNGNTIIKSKRKKWIFNRSSREVVYTCVAASRIFLLCPSSVVLSFSLDWTRSFIDRWEGSHDGRLCNLSFVSPRARRKKTCEEEQRAERTTISNSVERRTITPLRSPFATSSSVPSSPPFPFLPPPVSLVSHSLFLSFF